MVKMVLGAWYSAIKEADSFFENLSDEELQNDVAPYRNTGVYLLGHLTAVHDRMLTLLNLGERNYPQLDDPFISNPDKLIPQTIPTNQLRQYWKNLNSILTDKFNNLPAEAWFEKHNSVSAEDFAKEPHRNKLNVVISRTNHLAYHNGQLAFLKK